MLTESQTEKLLELKLTNFYIPSDAKNNTLKWPWKLSEEPNSNSQVDKESLPHKNGDSLNTPEPNIENSKLKVDSFMMDQMLNF